MSLFSIIKNAVIQSLLFAKTFFNLIYLVQNTELKTDNLTRPHRVGNPAA